MSFSLEFKFLTALFATVMRYKNMHMWENEMTIFELLEYSICCEILILKLQMTQDPFVRIL